LCHLICRVEAVPLLAGGVWYNAGMLPPDLIVSYLLPSKGVYLRDRGQVLGLAVALLPFLSPVFYPISALPERVQAFAYLNPLA
jgi:hypothetical protein